MTASDYTFRELSTPEFCITPAAHARVALRLYAGRWWPLILLPPLACLVAASANAAFIVAALIWLLLILPPALLGAYYSILLRPDTSVMVRPHTVTFGRDSLRVDFPQEFDAEDGDAATAEGSRPSPLSPIVINHEDVKSVSETSDYLVVNWSDRSHSKLLLIPLDIIPPGLADLTPPPRG